MEDEKQQKRRDPDADDCFLDRNAEERRDRRPPNMFPSENPPTLPTGQVIDSKNTLQSFGTRARDALRSTPGVTRHPIPPPPTLPSGAVIDSKNTLQSIRNVAPNTVPPSSNNAASNTIPTLPSGEVIDSKNTLQSVGTRARGVATPGVTRHPIPPPPTLPSGAVIDSKNTLQSIRNVAPNTAPPSSSSDVSNTIPTLPSGEIIDSKNTLRSFRTRSAHQNHPSQPPTNSSSSNNTSTGTSNADTTVLRHPHTPASNTDEDVVEPAEHVYEAELVTDPPRRKSVLALLALGIVAVVIVVVIMGVCFSGNCGSNDGSQGSASVTRRPTVPPTASPTATPVDVLAERAVSAFVNNITYLDQEILVTGTSAESMALAWIVQEDPLFTMNKTALLSLNSMHNDEVGLRVRQRYALATLWFQQVEEGVFIKTWETITGWLSESECNWFGINCVNESVVTEIMFFNYDTLVANDYSGSIPPDIGLLTSLEWFSMRSNKVTGSIPESIGQCRQMKLFDVSGGSVNGTIPSSLGQWTEISHFDLSKNNIVGTIPSFIGNWSQIKYASFEMNDFTGTMPFEICPNIQDGDTLSCDCQVNCSCCTISCSI